MMQDIKEAIENMLGQTIIASAGGTNKTWTVSNVTEVNGRIHVNIISGDDWKRMHYPKDLSTDEKGVDVWKAQAQEKLSTWISDEIQDLSEYIGEEI